MTASLLPQRRRYKVSSTYWQLPTPGPLNLLCGVGNLATFGLQAGNMKFNRQND